MYTYKKVFIEIWREFPPPLVQLTAGEAKRPAKIRSPCSSGDLSYHGNGPTGEYLTYLYSGRNAKSVDSPSVRKSEYHNSAAVYIVTTQSAVSLN